MQMTDSTEKTTDIIQSDSLMGKLTLSARMQDEYDRCVHFMRAVGADVTKACAEFENMISDGNEVRKGEGLQLNKNDSKKALSMFRKFCIEYAEKTNDSAYDDVKKDDRTEDKSDLSAGLFSETFLEEDIDMEKLPEKIRKSIGKVTRIHHYKDVFNAKNNDFLEQKHSGKVILANNRDKLFYHGAAFCQSFGNEHFYYTSCVKNCIYDCGYCYLRGMYPCGYITIFVNLEDYFAELEQILSEHDVYLCVSYDTDLLALEPLLGYCRKWIEFAGSHKNLKIEIRTKCGNAGIFEALRSIATDNVIFAWTLSPDSVRSIAEKKLPKTSQRLKAAKAAKDAGFSVRLCFDPMIFHPGWKKSYANLINETFTVLNSDEICDISVGVFRISNNYLRRMRNMAEDIITTFPYVTENGACHYGDMSEEMQSFALNELKKFYPKEKIFTWTSETEDNT